MALGLATGVIAQVVNTMGMTALPMTICPPAKMTRPTSTKYQKPTSKRVLGHVLNLAINALGSYVHTSRLQYVEFFGKFFEGGGQPFRPLKPATKYVYVNNQNSR